MYRARALHSPDFHFDHVFEVDRGGMGMFEVLPNAEARIVQKSRMINYLNYILSESGYDQVRITTQPAVVGGLNVPKGTDVVYEIHSPTVETIRRELVALDVSKVDEVWVPSGWSANTVQSVLPNKKHVTVRVVPNLVDDRSFHGGNGEPRVSLSREGIPISWIGRLENTQKNYLDFLRLLSILPEKYYGLMLYSYENDPGRLEKFLGDAAMLGVVDRVRLYSDVPQADVADIHRAVRDAGGVFCSTALSESFGYAVLEAGLCGCGVVGYDVGPLAEHPVDGVRLVPVGDILALRDSILAATN